MPLITGLVMTPISTPLFVGDHERGRAAWSSRAAATSPVTMSRMASPGQCGRGAEVLSDARACAGWPEAKVARSHQLPMG